VVRETERLEDGVRRVRAVALSPRDDAGGCQGMWPQEHPGTTGVGSNCVHTRSSLLPPSAGHAALKLTSNAIVNARLVSIESFHNGAAGQS
jgi:hypothetical protein